MNTASRIENLTKSVGAKILAHSAVIEKSTLPNLSFRTLGDISLRGKLNNTPLSEILNSLSEQEKSAKLSCADGLKDGIACFNEGRLDAALEVLEKAAALCPEDKAVAHFIQRVKSKRSPKDYSRTTD